MTCAVTSADVPVTMIFDGSSSERLPHYVAMFALSVDDGLESAGLTGTETRRSSGGGHRVVTGYRSEISPARAALTRRLVSSASTS